MVDESHFVVVSKPVIYLPKPDYGMAVTQGENVEFNIVLDSADGQLYRSYNRDDVLVTHKNYIDDCIYAIAQDYIGHINIYLQAIGTYKTADITGTTIIEKLELDNVICQTHRDYCITIHDYTD